MHPHDLDAERERSTPNLVVKPFEEVERTAGFSCGDPDLDAFLATPEAGQYEREWLGRTYLVFFDGAMAAYFTLSAAELRIEYLLPREQWAGFFASRIEAIPALKIGRLAVDSRFQGRGIGKGVLRHIVGMALTAGDSVGVRMIVLHAKPDSVPFYQGRGFQFTVSTKRERRRKNRTMFLDL